MLALPLPHPQPLRVHTLTYTYTVYMHYVVYTLSWAVASFMIFIVLTGNTQYYSPTNTIFEADTDTNILKFEDSDHNLSANRSFFKT